MPSFTIPSLRNGDHLTVEIDVPLRWSRASFDGWLDVRVGIKVGGFTGKYTAQFEEGDLLRFLEDLAKLYEQLAGTIQFQTMERQLEFEVVGDGLGHFEAWGVATDGMSSENSLHF